MERLGRLFACWGDVVGWGWGWDRRGSAGIRDAVHHVAKPMSSLSRYSGLPGTCRGLHILLGGRLADWQTGRLRRLRRLRRPAVGLTDWKMNCPSTGAHVPVPWAKRPRYREQHGEKTKVCAWMNMGLRNSLGRCVSGALARHSQVAVEWDHETRCEDQPARSAILQLSACPGTWHSFQISYAKFSAMSSLDLD